MTDKKWLTDRELASRYGVSRTWIWNQARREPKFPKPVKFSNGTTRFSVEKADQYDAEKLTK
ncbi:hypothetical protein N8760_07165 [Rhodobacteraceae bacterium]|nr:hypothetical protein [Paracoccaceae bacterium]